MTNSSTTELDEKLLQLQQMFFIELKKIHDKRLLLEKDGSSCKFDLSATSSIYPKLRNAKLQTLKPFSVRLEPSLGEKLAKTRSIALKHEDKLSEMREAINDELQTAERIKKDLDQRENLLIQSVQQIEAYLRAIFYLKYEADDIFIQLENTSKLQDVKLQEMQKDFDSLKDRKKCIIKAISIFSPAKLALENQVSDLPSYSCPKDLVEQYFVLKELQRDILKEKHEREMAENTLQLKRMELAEYKSRFPFIITSKQHVLQELDMKLENIKSEIALIQEEMDISIRSKMKEYAESHEFQKWIKKIFDTCNEFKTPDSDETTTGTLDMLDGILDFVADALEMVERLKREKAT